MPQKTYNIFYLAAGVYALAALFSVGYYHPDEHFQLLEFAGLKLGWTTADLLPWEYAEAMRPTLQVYLVLAVQSILDLLGLSNPFTISTILRLLSAGLALGVAIWLVKMVRPTLKSEYHYKLLSFYAMLLWFLVFIHVRYSSENWSGISLLVGYILLVYYDRKLWWRVALAGFFLCLSFEIRYQMAIAVGGLLLWLLVKRENLRTYIYLFIGALIAFGIARVSDYFYYEEWVLAPYNYFYQNLVEGKAASFGVEPWWYYLTESLVVPIPPIGLIYLFALGWLVYKKPKSPIIWVLVPFLLVHSLIGHKEFRFLFPIASFVPLLVVEALELQQLRRDTKAFKWTAGLVFTVNIIAVTYVSLAPANSNISFFKYMYDQYPEATTLHYEKWSPYQGRRSDQYFYKRMNLEGKKLSAEGVPEYDSGRTNLLVLSSRSENQYEHLSKRLVYRSMPQWLEHFNFNGWLDRTEYWMVYELD